MTAAIATTGTDGLDQPATEPGTQDATSTEAEGQDEHELGEPALEALAEHIPLLAPADEAAFKRVYDGLPEDVIATCEEARIAAAEAATEFRDTMLYALHKARAALAPSGLVVRGAGG
ncbi:MAG TPA: hypothetical protein VGP82_24530 [Ktedonobacterales bacterium]|jgi:hypothetical protein|nr:hypothetical protein [Ktedonobacterales bacterium]